MGFASCFSIRQSTIAALSDMFCSGGGCYTYRDDITKYICFINEGYLDLCLRLGSRVWVQKPF